MTVVIIPTVGLFLAALVLGRWWIAILPVVGWPLVFTGFNLGWWGYGVGDFWQQAMVIYMLIGLAAVIGGLLFRRLLLRGGRSRPGGW